MSFALRYEKVIIFVLAALTTLGVRAYLQTSQSIFPPMTFPRIDVVADAGDLPPEQVAAAVTRPLEAAFVQLPAVKRVRTTSSQGSAEFLLDFEQTTDPHVDLQYVDEAISQIRGTVAAARNVNAVLVNPNREPVLSYALTSSTMSDAALRDYALLHIVRDFYGVQGIGRSVVAGGPTREYHIVLDPAKLHFFGLSANTVKQRLAEVNTVQAVGATDRSYQRYIVVVDAGLRDLASLRAIEMPMKNGGTVALSDLGRVEEGISPIIDAVSLNGRHAIMLNVYALPNADTVRLAQEFRARLSVVERTLPAIISVTNFWDQTTLVVDSQSALRDAILIGALLAILVIYAFLRDVRLVVIAATMIPLAMAITIFAVQQTGQTLNLMSVGGLAVAVGLIIDDAIVVIENIARTASLDPGRPIVETIMHAMRQITAAMIASTTTTVVVFLPLALLSGVTGFFFRALAFTLSASLVVSLVLALLLAPILARFMLQGAGVRPHRHDAVAAVLERYDPLLRWALGHRAQVAAASALIFIVTVALLATMQSNFLPKMDEGQFEIGYTLPSGTSLSASDAAAREMERIVSADPAVASVGRLTAIDSNGISPTQANSGSLRVRLVGPDKRPVYEIVSERIRKRLEEAVPSSTYDEHQILEDIINDLSGSASPIAIEIRGDDQATLIKLATELTSRLNSVQGIVDTSSGIVYDDPALRITPRADVLARLGLTWNDVVDQAASLTQGTVATNITDGNILIPVRVSTVPETPLETSLGYLSSVRPMHVSSEITTDNGQQVAVVTANISGASLSQVAAGIDNVLRNLALPAGYRATIGGAIQTQAQSFGEFLAVIAVAVGLVYVVMLATFHSFRLPLVILTAIPLALIGVAGALRMTATPFNVSSFMGLLLLVGIVVKNGILLIDVANHQRAEGLPTEEALVVAGKTRLRPIVMTTLAAIGGLFPLALGIGQGAEMEKPLAIAVIGGLSTATIFTLIVIPVLYAAFAGNSAGRVPQEERV